MELRVGMLLTGLVAVMFGIGVFIHGKKQLFNFSVVSVIGGYIALIAFDLMK